jgi:hypothetical protein
MNLYQYLEETTDIAMGIRYVENALTSLYSLVEYLKDENKNQISIQRKQQYTNENLMKAVGFFGLHEYIGKAIPGSLADKINMSITSLSKILTDYNNGIDDGLGWGKVCADIIASINTQNKEINNDTIK